MHFHFLYVKSLNEPLHDKTSKMTERPARLRSAWASAQSDSLRFALKDPSFLYADSKDSD